MASEIGELLVDDLLPFPDKWEWDGKISKAEASLRLKVDYYTTCFFKTLFHLALFPVAVFFSMAKYTVSVFSAKKSEPVLEKRKYTIEELAAGLPRLFGGSSSFFQNDGLSTRYGNAEKWGKSDWYDWLTSKNPIIETVSIDGEQVDLSKVFSRSLEQPEQYIEEVHKALGVSGDRSSLEWSLIEPEEGRKNPEAIALYRAYFQKLIENGIEPVVTLNHFVLPKWFLDKGGFLKEENIDLFVAHALAMIELFPEIRYWIEFNEINVDAFQKFIRGVYPPGEVGAFQKAGIAMRNMLIAHMKIYKKVQEKKTQGLLHDVQLGSSHQWINFEPFEGNFLEKMICYVLSKITHHACINFWKTGKFSFEMPGYANVQLEVSEEEFKKYRGFKDFLGVQNYGTTLIRAGFNGGKAMPGFETKNFTIPQLGFGVTFGATCKEGGAVQSFGPSVDPKALRKCLEEAIKTLFPGQKIIVSETGGDARIQFFGSLEWLISEEVQADTIEQILALLHEYKDVLEGIFIWTPIKGLEWERVSTPHLHIGELIKDEQGNIIGYKMSLAALLLQKVFHARQRALRAQEEEERKQQD